MLELTPASKVGDFGQNRLRRGQLNLMFACLGVCMAFTTKTRYGAMESYSDDLENPEVVESLICEPETEQFERERNLRVLQRF